MEILFALDKKNNKHMNNDINNKHNNPVDVLISQATIYSNIKNNEVLNKNNLNKRFINDFIYKY